MLDERDICAKTAQGLAELSSRARSLPPRLRTLLILVDGVTNVERLRASALAMGAPPDALDELVKLELIAVTWPSPKVLDVAPAASAPTSAPAAVPRANTDTEQFQVARKFMNDTVVDSLGLRSFFFTLKLERCFNRSELVALVPDYVKAITKGSGAEVAKGLERHLLELLA